MFPAKLAAGLALALACLPAAARDLSGRLVTAGPEALPEAAAVMISIRKSDGTQVDLELATNGAQPPLPFRLQVPDGALTLQVSIAADDETIWVAAPVEVAEGSANVALGEIALTSYRRFPLAAAMACGDEILRFGLADGRLRILRGEADRMLLQDPAARAPRYADETGSEVRIRDGDARVVWQGEDLPACRAVATPLTAEITARGNEPGWVLKAGPDSISYVSQAGETVAMEGASEPRLTAEGRLVFRLQSLMTVTFGAGPCRDTMTGMPHPLAVSVDWAGETLKGCGGDPFALLEGDWQLAGIGGDPLPEGVAATMRFAEGGLSGYGGCNDYSATVKLGGEGLSFGPVRATKMACFGEAMEVETGLFDALGKVTRFDVDGNEASFLAGDVPVLTALRVHDLGP